LTILVKLVAAIDALGVVVHEVEPESLAVANGTRTIVGHAGCGGPAVVVRRLLRRAASGLLVAGGLSFGAIESIGITA